MKLLNTWSPDPSSARYVDAVKPTIRDDFNPLTRDSSSTSTPNHPGEPPHSAPREAGLDYSSCRCHREGSLGVDLCLNHSHAVYELVAHVADGKADIRMHDRRLQGALMAEDAN